MLDRESVTAQLQKELPYLNERFGVKRIGLFGSVAAGTATKDSDIDLVVEFARPIGLCFVSLVDYLEQSLGAKIDLLTVAGLQGVRVPSVAETIEETLIYVEAT